MSEAERFSAKRTFAIIWLGQLVSLVGSGLTSFALSVWVYQQTGSVTRFMFVLLCALVPGIVIAPLAGALVDRYDRRLVMLLSDVGSALSTLPIGLLYISGHIEMWHIYVANACLSFFSAFRLPAYTAIIPTLFTKEQLGRANGLVQLGQAAGRISAPVLGGALLVGVGIQGVIFIDVASYVFAVATLSVIKVPRLRATEQEAEKKAPLLRQMAFGWNYLLERPGLLGLLFFYAAINFLVGMVSVLVTPLVLAVASAPVLGVVMSIGGLGMLAGGVLMSTWGGPKRRIHGVLGFMLLAGVAIILGGVRPSIVLFAVAAFGFFFALPIMNGSSQVIWQTKVAPEVQGRVFAISGMFAMSSLPLGYLAAGPLADRVFEPLLRADGALASSVGRIIGVGPGRGIGLLFILTGFMTIALVAVSYLYPRIRLVEDELPDMIGDAETGDDAKTDGSEEAAPGLNLGRPSFESAAEAEGSLNRP
jgi:MFS family permease